MYSSRCRWQRPSAWRLGRRCSGRYPTGTRWPCDASSRHPLLGRGRQCERRRCSESKLRHRRMAQMRVGFFSGIQNTDPTPVPEHMYQNTDPTPVPPFSGIQNTDPTPVPEHMYQNTDPTPIPHPCSARIKADSSFRVLRVIRGCAALPTCCPSAPLRASVPSVFIRGWFTSAAGFGTWSVPAFPSFTSLSSVPKNESPEKRLTLQPSGAKMLSYFSGHRAAGAGRARGGRARP